MKAVKKFVFAVLLLSAFAVKTFAGDIETPGYATPPPPPHVMTASTETTALSSTSDPYAEQSGETVDTLDYLLSETVKALLLLY